MAFAELTFADAQAFGRAGAPGLRARGTLTAAGAPTTSPLVVWVRAFWQRYFAAVFRVAL